ncbi:FG-GAP-like repeat-containing protein [Micromonospora sp. NPDC047670]|uniref:FG-GAP-like repeat-containing protein n=1 Tax=Micromonospora sp. NPDC047670 TaxID=3364252 RepID=UPI00371C3708
MGRSLPAGALATTLALGLLTVPAAPAASDTGTAPREIAVIPEYEPTVLPVERILLAGESGFLHKHNASTNHHWTRYDTGETVAAGLNGYQPSDIRPAGGDAVSVWERHPVDDPTRFGVYDLRERTWDYWPRPAEGSLFGVFGRSILVRHPDMGLELRTVGAEGDVTESRPVAGLPAGSGYLDDARVGDAASVVVPATGPDGKRWYGLLDIATARVVPIPGAGAAPNTASFRLSGDTVAWVGAGAVHVHSRAGLTSGTDTAARTATIAGTWSSAAVLGDRVVALADPPSGATEGSVVTVALDGTSRTVVLPRAQARESLVQGPGGTALAVGGSTSRDWAVHRYTATPGEPARAAVMPVRDPVDNAGLAIRRGIVRHLQTQVLPSTGETYFALFNHALSPDAAGAVAERAGTVSSYSVRCPGEPRCVRIVDGAQDGVTYLREINGQTMISTRRAGDLSMVVPTTGARLVDAMDEYAVVDGGSPATQYVAHVAETKVLRTGPIRAAALWFDTLWTATGANGQLQQLSLPSLKVQRSVSTGAACVPTEVQTGARWLWWACGATGPAGVYDLRNNRNITVPSGPALLGDGFLVRYETGALRMTAFHDGTLHAPVTLAGLPKGAGADSRGHSWAVDRQGRGVAYVDGDNAVHVIDTGVPGTAPAIGRAVTSASSHPRTTTEEARYWTGTFHPTRPLSSWRVTVTRKSTGDAVMQRTGGPARDRLDVRWDGRLPSGGFAASGGYRWTVYGTTDGGPETTIGSGSLLVICGAFPFRTVDCTGSPSLLGVKSTGAGHWYGDTNGGEPTGELLNNGWTDNWCLSCTGAARTSALVPFGDYNGDAHPDLLVRDGNGYLKAHLGNSQMHFGGAATVSLGGGWMMYRSILAPGDVNSDGHHDILGIDTYGKLWLYTTTGRGGINPRVQVGSGWGTYPKVIGAGDLNGDGHGDLLGIDTTGTMYRYTSNGNKGWSGRVKVFAGWNIYNSVVAIGDLDQDGRNDLVARDAGGILWRYSGLGNGSFAPRVQRGSGWNTYKIIV